MAAAAGVGRRVPAATQHAHSTTAARTLPAFLAVLRSMGTVGGSKSSAGVTAPSATSPPNTFLHEGEGVGRGSS